MDTFFLINNENSSGLFSLRKLEVAESKCLVLTSNRCWSACSFPNASYSHKASRTEKMKMARRLFSVADRWPTNTEELSLLAFWPLFSLPVPKFS